MLIWCVKLAFPQCVDSSEPCSFFSLDNCNDLNSELQRVLMGLESVVCGHKKIACSLSVAEVERHIEQLTMASQHCDLAIKVQLTSDNLVDFIHLKNIYFVLGNIIKNKYNQHIFNQIFPVSFYITINTHLYLPAPPSLKWDTLI